MDEKNYFSVKQISDMYQISIRTLQYYDDLGILKVKRLENGYRAYTQESLYTLDTILLLKGCGLELSEIRHYLYAASSLEQDDILNIAKEKLLLEKQKLELALTRIDNRGKELKDLNKIIPGRLFEAERNKKNIEFIDKEKYAYKKGNTTNYYVIPMNESYLISILDKDGNFIMAGNPVSEEKYEYEKIAYTYLPYHDNFKELFKKFTEMIKDYHAKDNLIYTYPVFTEKNEYYHYFEIIIDNEKEPA